MIPTILGYNENGPGGASNTLRGLTRLLDMTKEGLAMNATRRTTEECDKFTYETYSEDVARRFWSKVDKTDSCWRWTAATTGGYGSFYLKRVNGRAILQRAHRWSYLVNVGPVPVGHVIDHLCRNRACVNPGHLEAVTPQVNAERGLWGDLKTHCPAGHPYDDGNTSRRSTRRSRECIECRKKQTAERRLRNKSRLDADPTVVKHGTLTAYNDWLCRCQECRDAQASYQRERKLKRARRSI